MKKIVSILFVLLSLFAVSGCKNNSEDNVEKVIMSDGAKIEVRKFIYDGHQYIEFFRHAGGYDNYTGYVHDPNCWCMVDYD